MLLDHGGYLRVFAHVTGGRVHEVNIAKALRFPAESIAVMDRGHADYEMFSLWASEDVNFVTRLKDNADFSVVEELSVPDRRNILGDRIIRLEGFYSKRKCPDLLRRIEIWDVDNEQVVVLLTNHLTLDQRPLQRSTKTAGRSRYASRC